MELGVDLAVARNLYSFDGRQVVSSCGYTGATRSHPAQNLLLVTARQPNDGLFHALTAISEEIVDGPVKTVRRIGECDSPAIIAAAVVAGHREARELGEQIDRDNPLKYDRVFFDDG